MSEEICRTRRLARQCGYEDSQSVCGALDQMANEVAQEKDKEIKVLQERYDTLHDQRHEEARKADTVAAECRCLRSELASLRESFKVVLVDSTGKDS